MPRLQQQKGCQVDSTKLQSLLQSPDETSQDFRRLSCNDLSQDYRPPQILCPTHKA